MIDRKENLAKKKAIREKLIKVYQTVDRAFLDAADRINDTLDYWDCYNCVTGQNQYYNGNAQAYVPIIHDAVRARKTRFVSQIFPPSGRYVEVITADENLPMRWMGLLDHYVRQSKLRSEGLPAMFVNGDVEGQWNVYVDWKEYTRHVVQRERKGLVIDELVELEIDHDDPDTYVEDIKHEKINKFGPCVEILPDMDVMVWPATASTIEEALEGGGGCAIIRRWSKAELERMQDEVENIDKKAVQVLIDQMDGKKDNPRKDMKKEHADAAGVKAGGYTLGYEVWTKLKVEDDIRLTKTLYGGEDSILICTLNPFWCDLCPLISAPVDKISGSFKGISSLEVVKKLQWMANDYLNMGADSATFGMMPIIMTDPISNPRVSSMVLDLGAVWEVDPNKTKFAAFPEIWQHALEIVGAFKEQIFQTLSVNPSMVPQRSSAKKPSQAEIAAEQQVDMLTTADVVVPCEESILTEIINRFVWYDMQFRTEPISVKAWGREGIKATMEEIPPAQVNHRMEFLWYGVEQARNAQQLQLQMSGMNVLKEIPPQMIPGRRINLVPLIERFVEGTFGPKLAPNIFEQIEAMPADKENILLSQGFDLPVSPIDNDMEHLQVHQQIPPSDVRNSHLYKHQLQMGQKNEAMAAQQQGQQPGQGGGGPRPGAQVQKGRNQGPPGMIHQDQMPLSMPRKQ